MERMSREERSEQQRVAKRARIVEAGLAEARDRGYRNVRRSGVASRAGVSPGLVSHYFNPLPLLHDAIMREAVERGIVDVVRQGLADGHAGAQSAPLDLRMRALTS